MRIWTTHTHPTDDVIEHEIAATDCVCGPETKTWMREDGDIARTITHHSLYPNRSNA